MLENGMIINQDNYTPMLTCKHCRQEVNEVTTYTNGDSVCEDCEYEYLQKTGLEYVDEYVENNAQKYYLEWFEELSDHEQLNLIKSAYKRQEQLDDCIQSLTGLLKDHRDYWCINNENFISHVGSILK